MVGLLPWRGHPMVGNEARGGGAAHTHGTGYRAIGGLRGGVAGTHRGGGKGTCMRGHERVRVPHSAPPPQRLPRRRWSIHSNKELGKKKSELKVFRWSVRYVEGGKIP